MKYSNRNTRSLILLLAAVSICIGGSCTTNFESGVIADREETLSEMSDPEFAPVFKMIESAPGSANGHVLLASLYIKRARRTGDFSLNKKAESAIGKALALEPQHAMARKLNASLLATFHRFSEAREAAKELQKEFPDDSFVYGVLTDANAELGKYPEAVESAQKMVDLKPNSSSYARVGHLRSLHGDHEGAVEMLRLAVKTTDPADREAQSWGLVQLGKEHFMAGDLAKAEKAIDEALTILPDYITALTEKGRMRAAAGDHAAAESCLLRARDAAPQHETLILLGDLKQLQGKSDEAADLYRQGEDLARGADGDIHRFALLWADHNTRLDEALKVATDDYAVVKDIYAADILAWCLFKKGRLDEAKKAIDEAMRLKTNDARILYHAGMIEKARGNNAEARRFLANALEINPHFDLLQAEAAKNNLAELGG